MFVSWTVVPQKTPLRCPKEAGQGTHRLLVRWVNRRDRNSNETPGNFVRWRGPLRRADDFLGQVYVNTMED